MPRELPLITIHFSLTIHRRRLSKVFRCDRELLRLALGKTFPCWLRSASRVPQIWVLPKGAIKTQRRCCDCLFRNESSRSPPSRDRSRTWPIEQCSDPSTNVFAKQEIWNFLVLNNYLLIPLCVVYIHHTISAYYCPLRRKVFVYLLDVFTCVCDALQKRPQHTKKRAAA